MEQRRHSMRREDASAVDDPAPPPHTLRRYTVLAGQDPVANVTTPFRIPPRSSTRQATDGARECSRAADRTSTHTPPCTSTHHPVPTARGRDRQRRLDWAARVATLAPH